MGHELDATDGVYSYADSRSDAWHQLGQQVGHLMSGEEVLREAHLANWNVRKEPLFAEVGGHRLAVPDQHVIIRDNPIVADRIDALSVVGNHYEPFQAEQSIELLDALAEEGGARFETAGALRGGRETFVTMRLPQNLEVRSPITGKIDLTALYIAALNSHDGNSPFRMIVTPIRIVCANTQTAALGAAVSSWSIRHTVGAVASLAEARRSLGLALTYADVFGPAMVRMAEAEISDDEVRRVFAEITGALAADTDAQREGRLRKVGSMMEVYRRSDTVAPFAGTRFGAFNAVTEYVDHLAPTLRSANSGAQRAARTLSHAIAPARSIKSAAFDLLSV